MSETEFHVQNMKCGGCISAATKALEEKVIGFEGVDFELDAGIALVKGDIDPQAVIAALTEAGYPAVVKSV